MCNVDAKSAREGRNEKLRGTEAWLTTVDGDDGERGWGTGDGWKVYKLARLKPCNRERA